VHFGIATQSPSVIMWVVITSCMLNTKKSIASDLEDAGLASFS